MVSYLMAVSIWKAHIWYAVPLAIAISLVYGATRHESIPEIMRHWWQAIVWVGLFMAGIAVLVLLGGFGVT